MIEIKDLLSRFKSILENEEVKKTAIIEVLEKTIGLKVNREDIRLKNNILYLNIKSIYKNEIFLKKEEIISFLKEKLNKAPDDII